MINVTCEFVWIRDLLSVLNFAQECPVRLYCNNQVAVHIVENSVFHEHTKYLEVDYHLTRQKIEENIVQTRQVLSGYQLTDLVT